MKLSVITINYNNEEGLHRTIESVINQTFQDFEYIVIDGGSTDKSPEIITHFAQKLKYWISEKDNGVYHAMNKGIKQAFGEYLLFLNSGDDLIRENILEEIFKEDRREDIIYGDITYFDTVEKQLLQTSLPDKLDLFFFYKQSIWHQAAFIRRALFEKYSEYNENNRFVSDWEFFLKRIIIDNCSYKKINLVITNYDMYNGISVKNNDLRIKEMNDISVQLFPSYIIELLEDHFLIENEIKAFRKSIFYRFYRKYKKLKKHI